MVKEHGANWASVFAKRMQSVLDDERSSAFSTFVYTETCRVFHDTAALHVPGGGPQSRTPAVAGSRIRGKIATSLTSEAQCRCVGGSWNVW